MRYTARLLASSVVLCALPAPTTGVLRSHGPPLHGTLLATNMNDNTVTVLDLASGRTLATLPTGTWSDGVAYSALAH